MTQPASAPTPSRPFSVTLLALGVLIIAGLNLTRLILTVRQWAFLSSLPGVSPIYLALTGFIWALTGLPLVWGLWRGLPWAPRLAQALALTYAAYYWLDHIFLAERLAGQGNAASGFLPLNWPFAAAITAILMVFVSWTLSRPKTKDFFGELHE